MRKPMVQVQVTPSFLEILRAVFPKLADQPDIQEELRQLIVKAESGISTDADEYEILVYFFDHNGAASGRQSYSSVADAGPDIEEHKRRTGGHVRVGFAKLTPL